MRHRISVVGDARLEPISENCCEPSLEQVVADPGRTQAIELVDLVAELPKMSDGMGC